MNKILVFTVVLIISSTAFGQLWEIPQGTPTIDANLSDWSNANWIAMESDIDGDPANISNARMALKWDTNNIYMAVTYDDADLQLSQGVITWDGQDDLEVFINANNDNAAYGGPGGSDYPTTQQYFVGPNGTAALPGLSSTAGTGTWSNLGSILPLPDAGYPYAVIDAATSVSGSSVTYEMRLPALNDIVTGSLQTLAVGDTVGVDVVAADKGTSNYGQKALNMIGGKSTNASNLVDCTLVNELTTVHYTFEETSSGTWDVLVEITGDTAGLSGYEIWIDGVDPETVTFAENVLGYGAVGFLSGTLLQGDVGGYFNAGNYQNSDTAIEGIGKVAVNEVAVVLDVPALLGTLSTEAGLTEANFRVMLAGLLNELGDGYLDTGGLVPTMEVIPFVAVLLAGDANRDGVVSAGDYSSVQANFGSTGIPGIPGDANGDGVVSAGDYASVQANFGNTAPPAGAVPEPATLAMLGIGALAVIRRKK